MSDELQERIAKTLMSVSLNRPPAPSARLFDHYLELATAVLQELSKTHVIAPR